MNLHDDLSACPPTERLKKILWLAADDAAKRGHPAVAPEHLLMGILNDGEGPAIAVFEELEMNPHTIRLRTQNAMISGAEPMAVRDLPYTQGALLVLEGARSEADGLGHSYLGSEHLLLGLLHESKSIAAKVLNGLGLTLAEARAQVRHILSP